MDSSFPPHRLRACPSLVHRPRGRTRPPRVATPEVVCIAMLAPYSRTARVRSVLVRPRADGVDRKAPLEGDIDEASRTYLPPLLVEGLARHQADRLPALVYRPAASDCGLPRRARDGLYLDEERVEPAVRRDDLQLAQASRPRWPSVAPQRTLRFRADIDRLDRAVLDVLSRYENGGSSRGRGDEERGMPAAMSAFMPARFARP